MVRWEEPGWGGSWGGGGRPPGRREDAQEESAGMGGGSAEGLGREVKVAGAQEEEQH